MEPLRVALDEAKSKEFLARRTQGDEDRLVGGGAEVYLQFTHRNIHTTLYFHRQLAMDHARHANQPRVDIQK